MISRGGRSGGPGVAGAAEVEGPGVAGAAEVEGPGVAGAAEVEGPGVAGSGEATSLLGGGSSSSSSSTLRHTTGVSSNSWFKVGTSPPVSFSEGAGRSVTCAPTNASSAKMWRLIGQMPVARKPLRTLVGVQAEFQALEANSGSICSVMCLLGCMRA